MRVFRTLSVLVTLFLFTIGTSATDLSSSSVADDKGVAKEARAKTRVAFERAAKNRVNENSDLKENGEKRNANPSEEFYSNEVANSLIEKEARPLPEFQPQPQAAIQNNPVTDRLIGKERATSATEARTETFAKFHATQAADREQQKPSEAFYSAQTAEKVIEKEAKPGEYQQRAHKIDWENKDHLAQQESKGSQHDSSASPQYFMKDILSKQAAATGAAETQNHVYQQQQQPNAHFTKATTLDEQRIGKEARAKTREALATATKQDGHDTPLTGQDARRRSLQNGRRE
jgi:hypothetical protein